MENPSSILFTAGMLIFAVLAFMIFLFINKNDRIRHLQSSLTRLNKTFNDLDEQAKLIVKTDLELNKAQDELDKRLQSLEALQKISRLISTTLDEDEIFLRLSQSLTLNLNFEKNLILIYDETKNFKPQVNQGFSEDESRFILANFEKDPAIGSALGEGNTLSSINTPIDRREPLVRLFNTEHFVLSPILTQNGMIGILFVGSCSHTLSITEGDTELISILANQIGQSLQNARLFKQVFNSTQVLESRIQDRTRELASALEEVRRISRTKSEFISAVSHELRTPLTSIKGYASILMAGKLGNIPQEVHDRLEKINIHSNNLVKLINDLLDISRIESGRVEMNLSRISLAHIIESVHDLLTPQMREKNIFWNADIDPRTPDVLLDRSQIERVIINLVGNAIKFTPRDGTISIRVRHTAEDSHAASHGIAAVEVSDTGIGISETDIEKLFSEFYRVDNAINQNVKGTGLGLALAKKIVEAHKGRMWVTSRLGEGSTFHFTLPASKDAV